MRVLDVAVFVGGLPVVLIGDDSSHVHVIVASGLPPFMSHVRMTVEPSFIEPVGVCIKCIGHHTLWTPDKETGHTLDVRCK
jgi:hypothetical protein